MKSSTLRSFAVTVGLSLSVTSLFALSLATEPVSMLVAAASPSVLRISTTLTTRAIANPTPRISTLSLLARSFFARET